MKLFLPKLTAMAMVATTSSADALQWPSWASFRSSDNHVASGLSNSCDDGYGDGEYYTRQLWNANPNKGNCNNVWGFDDQADDMKEKRFPSSCTSQYCKCARDGVDDEVNEIEAECTWDDTTECNDLGNAAAERVVMDDWCSPNRSSSQSDTNSNPNWKAYCANEAVGICEGNVGNVANRWCPDKTMNGNDRKYLQDQCYYEVDDMVGNDVRRPPTARPTPRPTPRPNSPNPRPTPRPADRPVDRCGLNGKCGYCKQEYCPDVQERQDCKARLCSFEEELATTDIN